MKVIKIVTAVVGGLLLVLILVVLFAAGPVVKSAVSSAGPKVLGVPMSLEKASISIIRGNVDLGNLQIDNPEGFKTPYLFKLGTLYVKMDVGSLSSDTIIIEQLLIDSPEIYYEKGLTSSNIGELLMSLEEKSSGESVEKNEDDSASTESAKKVVIRDFQLRGGTLRVGPTLTGGKALTLKMAPVVLENVGEEGGGASLVDVVQIVLGSVASSVGNTLVGSINLLGDGAMAVGDLGLGSIKLAGDVVQGAGKLAGQGVSAVGNTALDVGKGVTKGVGKGIGAIGSGLKSVVPGGNGNAEE